ncbi:MAG: sigma 54-interacting transcriptional regulator [candidate division Zixibacteria bacterium]|nr:sigma 54-interacting transcriptional regulator [candidate division Zixibacteria bacterium]
MSRSLSAITNYRRDYRPHLTALLTRNDYGEAVRYFESIRTMLNDSTDIENGIAMRLGAQAYSSSGNPAKALPLIRAAIGILSQMASETCEVGECYLVLGNILREMGTYEEAEKAFRDAESLFRRNDAYAKAGDALNLIAGILVRRGALDEALGYLIEAVEFAKKDSQKRKLAYLFGNIGRIYTLLGKLTAAEEHIRLNIELSMEFSDELELARAYLALGHLHIQQNRFDAAEDALNHALDYIRRNRLEKEEVHYLIYSGELAIKSERYEMAERMLNNAAVISRKISPRTFLAALPIRHLAELYAKQGNYKKALILVRLALPMMERLKDRPEIGALHRIQAVCYEQLGQSDKARESYRRSIEILEEHKIKSELADSFAAMGESALFDTGWRIVYLCHAEEIYSGCGITIKVLEMQRKISQMEVAVRPLSLELSPTPRDNAFPTKNAAMIKIISQLHLLRNTDLPILLTGETGTGKDFLARYFHSMARPQGPFVAVNCAAVPESLMESELFGYQKGAFTGADNNKQGLFMAANNGVLLLDEIGELPLTLQAKLLRVLETKKLRPLGTAKEIELNTILIAATNRDLREMLKSNTFRLDLYYRLAGITIELPPLRERKEDIPYLLEYFLRKNQLLGINEKPEADMARQFMGYSWPGNIRQLENKIRQLSVLSFMTRNDSLSELARNFFEDKREAETNSLFEKVEQFEKQLLLEALTVSGGNKSEAARFLAIHESTLRAKMKRYNLEKMLN